MLKLNLNKIPVATRISAGAGIILCLVIVFAVTAYFHVNSIWQNTDDIYQHPLQVNNAARDFKTDIVISYFALRNLMLTDVPEQKTELIEALDSLGLDAEKQLTILYRCYRGDRRDIDSIALDLRKLSELRKYGNNITAPIKAGSRADYLSGIYADNRLITAAHAKSIIDCANEETRKFYQAADDARSAFILRLNIFAGCILILAVIILVYILTAINIPLKMLTEAATKYKQGDYSARCGYNSAADFAALAGAFNKMAAEVEIEFNTKKNTAQFAKTILAHNDLDVFSNSLLNALINITNADKSVLFIPDKAGSDFLPFASAGFEEEMPQTLSNVISQTELNSFIQSKTIRVLKSSASNANISVDMTKPGNSQQEMVLIPVIEINEMVSVILLYSVSGFSAAALGTLEDAWMILSAGVCRVLAFEKVKRSYEAVDVKNRLLEQNTSALIIQTNRLKKKNDELEQQKQELKNANQLKSTFLSNMSHELRSPLNSVITLSSVLKRAASDILDQENLKYLEIIERNGRHLLALINDILDLSRIEAGREEVVPGSINLQYLTGIVMENFRVPAENKNIILINNISADLLPLWSDEDKLRHILQNIIGNAVKFTDSGSVECRAKYDGNFLSIQVADTGIGIDPAHLPFIFDEFRQADEGTSRKYGGTGLGLAIAKKYTELLGGKISVESTVGSGSVFTILLPVQALPEINKEPGDSVNDLSTAPNSDSPAETTYQNISVVDQQESKNSSPNILLVEDNPDHVEAVKALLDSRCTLFVAPDSAALFDLLTSLSPDIILLDIALPGMNGFEIFTELRKRPQFYNTPIVAITAKAMKGDKESILAHGFNHYISKPIDGTELIACINTMLNRELHA